MIFVNFAAMDERLSDENSLFGLAENYVCNTGVSIFLTGKAGTGKTTFLHRIVEKSSKRCIVVAPTGVAAVNAGGVTIHSFFSLPLCPYLPDVKELVTEYQLPERHRQLRKEKADIIRTLDLLIIDEISMVRADLLDAVDDVLRRTRRTSKPFGGVQLLMIGDLQQLPPVVTESERPYLSQVYASPFFFNSKALSRTNYVTIELQKVFRQSDTDFIEVLNNLRDNKFSAGTRAALESRYNPVFEPPDNEPGWIRLTTHNRQADAINRRKLEALEGEIFDFEASVDGNFPQTAFPADEHLQLKVGAQVMFLRNDRAGRYYNGKIVIVKDISDGLVIVTDSDGESIAVERETWENLRYEIDSGTNEIKQISDGTFVQFPLRPAWAITIHKSQGLTFDKVVIDAAAAFSYGQVYVALSRCRTLEGIVLTSRIGASCLYDSEDISSFNASLPSEAQVREAYGSLKDAYFAETMTEVFDFQMLRSAFNPLYRIYHTYLLNTYPKQDEAFSKIVLEQVRPMSEVAGKFVAQVRANVGKNGFLMERAAKAAGYFVPRLEDVASAVVPLLSVEIDNKERKKEFSEHTKRLYSILGEKLLILKNVLENGFSVDGYHKTKTDCQLNRTPSDWKKEFRTISASRGRSKAGDNRNNEKTDVDNVRDVYADNRHPEAVEALINWRRDKYKAENVAAFCIMQQKTLLSIADVFPRSREELLSVSGFGKGKWDKYGQEILDLLSTIENKNV